MLRVGVRPGDKSQPPLLLFNGIGANIELVEPFLQALDGLEAITFDVPGVGGSPAPRVPYRPWHLARLSARVIEPPGKKVPGTVTVKPAIGATRAAALAQLRAAEQRAVQVLLSRLGGATPSLAQLYASVAASEATHVAVLDPAGLDPAGLDSAGLDSPGQPA